MEPIRLEKREPSPEDSRKLQYAGQRTAQEVFEELKYRLEGMGYLPDEYFLLGGDWEGGREIPQDAEIFCTADYGGSEGVYLDVALRWYEDGKPRLSTFATGKTLGESGSDLDRMYLIASAITKAFHGDRGTYARYIRLDEQPEPEDMILHLNPAEQRTVIQALAEQRERQENAMSQTEQLLRRMTGSITAYMDEVGQRPLRMSGHDKAALAIRDGEFETFSKILPRVMAQAGDLLIGAAGRPGPVGYKMSALVLLHKPLVSCDAYLTACKRAVDTGDAERVKLLVKQADQCMTSPRPSLPGEVILYAYENDHQNIAKDLLPQCTSEQIAAAPPVLLRQVVNRLDFQTAVELVDKGVQPGDYVVDILQNLTGRRQEWMAERLLEHGMPVASDNYAALYVCVNNKAAGIAKLLLDMGIDLDQYHTWAEKQPRNEGYEETMEELSQYWSELQSNPRQDGPAMGDMSL